MNRSIDPRRPVRMPAIYGCFFVDVSAPGVRHHESTLSCRLAKGGLMSFSIFLDLRPYNALSR